MGLDNVYEAIRLRVYRKKFGTRAWHLQAIISPLWIKERSELPKYFRKFAQANFAMGRYDWGFRYESMGFSRRKAPEDLVKGAA